MAKAHWKRQRASYLADLFGIFQSDGKSFRKVFKIRLAAAADTDAAVLRGDKGHADEDALFDQTAENLAGKVTVYTAINSDEVGGRGQGGQAVLGGNVGNGGP